MTDSPAARPVWLSASTIRSLEILIGDFEGSDQITDGELATLRGIVAAWDAAPADATEAADEAAADALVSHRHGTDPRMSTHVARAVLAALGAPT